MTNQKLINARWRFTDSLLKEYEQKFKVIFSDIEDELLILFNDLDIKREDLNKTASPLLKKKLAKEKRDWKNSGIISPYFQFLLDTYKPTNGNILKLFIFAVYKKHQKRQFDECKSLFVKVANNIYQQAYEEIKIKPILPLVLTWRMIKDWSFVYSFDVSFEDYILILNQVFFEETSRFFINSINQEINIDHTRITTLLQKQLHKLIYIHDDKSSGLVEYITRQVGNEAYIQPFPNQRVKFVAEMDNRTTKMCMSMNDFIFNTKDKNIFYRYSDEAKTKVRYEIDGLVVGINMPPITDHFHYCRSILTYQIDLNDKEIRRQLKKQSTK